MIKLLNNNPDLYPDEIALELTETLGITPSLTTVHQTLKLLRYTTKKVNFVIIAILYIINTDIFQLSKVALEQCEVL
jgi:hypothetical protein